MNDMIAKTNAQDALNMITRHLIDPCWSMKFNSMPQEQQNTLIVNKIYKDFPRGFVTFPWMIKNTIKEIVRRW